MGIESFFVTVQENNITNYEKKFTSTPNGKIPCTDFFMDFNSVIYPTTYRVLADLNFILYKIITDRIDNKKVADLLNMYNIILEDSAEKFSEKMSSTVVGDIIVEEVRKYVVNTLSKQLTSETVKLLYIAIDGVPSKGKMAEQKSRRYMGAFASGVKKKIFKKYEDELKKDNDRYRFETNRISWSTTNITPGTQFMDDLDKQFKSEKFVKSVKEVCPNMDKYIFSGPYEPGEGETKIVNYMRESDQKKGDYIFYSPDSDVVLLCMLLNQKFKGKYIHSLKMLRYNQQRSIYDLVDIDILTENIYRYVASKISKGVPDKTSIINDTVFIFTIFGDDFMPKIASFNVRYDFNKTVDKYISLIDSKKNGTFDYIVVEENGRRKIDKHMLLKLFNELKIDEGGGMQQVYIQSNYYNYNKLRKTITGDSKNPLQNIENFLSKLRKFNETVRQGGSVESVIRDTSFLSVLKKLARLGQPRNTNDDEFVKMYVDYYDRYKKLPPVDVVFKRYNKTVKDSFQRNRLERTLDYIDPKLKITSYDEELFQFENMLDAYVDKLNVRSLELGTISVDPNTYTFKTMKVVDSVGRYYKKYFGITDLSVLDKDMHKLLQNYIDGLMWVFEYYFNDYDSELHRDFADTWVFPYRRAPLITQIAGYLENAVKHEDFIKNILDRLHSHKVPRKGYFNSLEHMMYVSPVNYYTNMAPTEYREFVRKSEYYTDINEIVDSIDKDSQTFIDCTGQVYMSKCHMEVASIQDYDKDQLFIKQLRDIKLEPKTKKRASGYTKGSNNIFTHQY